MNFEFKCKYCYKDFETRASLVKHKCLQCDCHKKFLRHKHCSQEDGKINAVFKCKKCHKGFAITVSVDSDMGFKCDLCNKYFESGLSFKRHFKTFHGNFAMESNLIQPKRVVDPEDLRPFKCNFCDKEFSTQKSLNRHIKKSHAQWKCNFCDKSFASKASVANHAKMTHFGIILKKSCTTSINDPDLNSKVTFEPGFFEELGYLETSKSK